MFLVLSDLGACARRSMTIVVPIICENSLRICCLTFVYNIYAFILCDKHMFKQIAFSYGGVPPNEASGIHINLMASKANDGNGFCRDGTRPRSVLPIL